jgi:hypothetical protein
MANHKLSCSVISDLRSVCQGLVNRRLAMMEAGFPLSHAQVQAGVLPAKWREIAPQMKADGFTIPTDRRPRVRLVHERLTRGAAVQLTLRDAAVLVPTGFGTIAFDADVLDEISLGRLAKWVNLAVEERRLAKLVNRTVQEFLDFHAETTGHVQARWPKLVLLADRLTDGGPGTGYVPARKEEHRFSWKGKFHEKPRSLLRYRWHTETELDWARRHEPAMRLSETTLVSALLLPAECTEDAPVTAVIAGWTPLLTDPDRNMQ